MAVNFREPNGGSTVIHPVCVLAEKSGFLETVSGGAFGLCTPFLPHLLGHPRKRRAVCLGKQGVLVCSGAIIINHRLEA